MGTPARVLRRSVPLLLTTALAVFIAAATAWLTPRVAAPPDTTPPPLPWTGYAAIAATAASACLLATAAALPFVRTATHPSALRTE